MFFADDFKSAEWVLIQKELLLGLNKVTREQHLVGMGLFWFFGNDRAMQSRLVGLGVAEGVQRLGLGLPGLDLYVRVLGAVLFQSVLSSEVGHAKALGLRAFSEIPLNFKHFGKGALSEDRDNFEVFI